MIPRHKRKMHKSRHQCKFLSTAVDNGDKPLDGCASRREQFLCFNSTISKFAGDVDVVAALTATAAVVVVDDEPALFWFRRPLMYVTLNHFFELKTFPLTSWAKCSGAWWMYRFSFDKCFCASHRHLSVCVCGSDSLYFPLKRWCSPVAPEKPLIEIACKPDGVKKNNRLYKASSKQHKRYYYNGRAQKWEESEAHSVFFSTQSNVGHWYTVNNAIQQQQNTFHKATNYFPVEKERSSCLQSEWFHFSLYPFLPATVRWPPSMINLNALPASNKSKSEQLHLWFDELLPVKPSNSEIIQSSRFALEQFALKIQPIQAGNSMYGMNWLCISCHGESNKYD